MNTFISRLIFVFLIQGFAFDIMAHVELDYPAGGETLHWNETVTIQWHIAIPHNTLNWDLLVSTDGGQSWEVLQMNIPPNQTTYQWQIPSVNTTLARVSVIQDNDGMDYQDESQNFTIEQIMPLPVIDLAAMDTVIECNGNSQNIAIQTWLNNHGGAVVTNYCGVLNWTNNYTALSNGCGASGNALVTFTAVDQCGNTFTSAIISIADTDDPVIIAPASDMTVQCDGNGNMVALNSWLNNHGGAFAMDACGNVAWTNNYSTLTNGCGLTGNATVIFTVIDECGNTATSIGTFTIEDTMAPSIDIAAHDTIVDCGVENPQTIFQNWLENHGGAMANDLCGIVDWTNDMPVLIDDCIMSKSLTVNFIVSDECTNRDTTHATFTLQGISGTTTSNFPDLDFMISPNPASNLLKVVFDQNEAPLVQLILFDAQGKPVVVNREKSKEINIPINAYSPGVYFLQVETIHGIYNRKIIID